MDFFSNLLQRNPELAVFLAIGIGYWVGAFKVRGVGFGPVTGSLLAGLLIGLGIALPFGLDAAALVLAAATVNLWLVRRSRPRMFVSGLR